MLCFLSSLSATATRDVAQFRGLVAWTSRALAVLPVIALVSTARAEGERALSVSAVYATFSTPGVKMGSMAPPDVTPVCGTSLALDYEYTLGTEREGGAERVF